MEENKQDKKPERIVFETDDGPAEWYVIDETRINGCNYILVADAPEGDAECLILKDTAPADSKESVYEEVEDDDELDIVAGMFEEALGDTEIVG
ncbi:MAG: DUF1292 domain-containing protein [Lachnospiraceae bacterium]|jgi:uncharacterized protein YrzB (UPF0473 family)|nr:DUF1292 domain-containing protein [Lachnospiraceae bacterium]